MYESEYGDTTSIPNTTSDRAVQLSAALTDERSGRVVFISHCLLNENTRYLGGAFRPGAVSEVITPFLNDGTGICQMPCPEQAAWGGVLKPYLTQLYARPRFATLARASLPLAIAYTKARYRFLAKRVAREIADYRSSGFEIVGVVGVGASPTCGVTTALDLSTSLDAVMTCPLSKLDRDFMNDTVVTACARPGAGLYISALSNELRRRRVQVPLLEHDLRSEQPNSATPAGARPAGIAGGRERPQPTQGESDGVTVDQATLVRRGRR